MSINQIVIEGNLVDDPEREAIPQPNSKKHWYKVSFTIGHNHGKKGDYEEVDYHLVEAWSEVGRYVKGLELKKGDGVIVCGRLLFKKWEKEGVPHRRPYIELDKHGVEITHRKNQS
jgi:single-stranded DNA-binding protein